MTKIQKINKFFKKLKKFLVEDIYLIDQNTFNPIEKFLVDSYRIVSFAITDFFKDDCTIRAAALTYLVTLSFIPALTVGLFILRIFNIYQNIFVVIFEWMEKHAPFYEPMVRQILNIADNRTDRIIVSYKNGDYEVELNNVDNKLKEELQTKLEGDYYKFSYEHKNDVTNIYIERYEIEEQNDNEKK